MKTITIHHVSRIEGHAKITIQLDDAGQVDGHAVPRHPGPRLREVHRGPAVLRDAVDHGAHLRHLPGEPPARLVEGVRRDHGRPHPGDRGQAARAAPLRAVRAVARALVLPPLGARPAAGHGLRPGQAQRRRACSRSTPTRCATGSPCASSASRSSSGWRKERVHPSWTVPGGVNAPLDPHAREKTLAELPGGHGDRQAHARALEEDRRRLPGRDRVLLQLPDDVLRPRRPGRLAAAVRRQPALRRRRRRDRRRPGDARRTTPTYIGEATLPGLVPEGAVLPARRLPRGHLPRRPARAPQRRRPLRHAGGRRGARGVPRAARAHRPERLPLPLRAPDRGHLRPRADAAAARRPGHPRRPRSAPTPASTTSRASASSRRRAARSSTTTR